jgi:acetyl-CoA/propionyl-CoA carboxylase biotin carboxyl carrier protein
MPGTVVVVHVASGARVEAGQLLLTVEAMKMEHKLTAVTAGIVRIDLRVGDLVAVDQVVASIERDAAPGSARDFTAPHEPHPELECDTACTVEGDIE